MSVSNSAATPSRNGEQVPEERVPSRSTLSSSSLYHEVFEDFIDFQATACPRLRPDVDLALQPFLRHVRPQSDLVGWSVVAVVNGASSIEAEAQSNARMELHSDERHESMRRTANMVLAAVRGVLEVMEDSASAVIRQDKHGNRFRVWGDAGKFNFGSIVYLIILLLLMAVSLLGCGLVASQLAIDMLNLEGNVALLAGILPAVALFSGIKTYVSRKDFVVSPAFRLAIFIGSLIAVAANFLLLGSQSFDPENLGGSIFTLPPTLSFIPILAIDAVSIIGQAVLWNDLQRLRSMEKADEHPAFQTIRHCVAAESNLVSQLRVHETRALDALKWLEDRTQVVALKHEAAIRQHVNIIRRDGEKAITKSLKKISIPITGILMLFTFGCNASRAISTPQREVFIGVSCTEPGPTRTEVDAQIRKLIKVLSPGSYVHLLDLSDHRVIATLNVPERWNAGSLRGLGTVEALRKFSQFLAEDNEAVVRSNTGLDLPAVFKTIAATRRLNDKCPEVILCSDPQYNRRPNWSFLQGRSPSDSCIGHSATPFGSERLGIENAKLLVVVPRMNWGNSAAHEDRIERFWRLYSQRSAVQMHSFRSDLPGAFSDVIRQNYELVPKETPSRDSFLGLYSEAKEEIEVIEGPTNRIQVRPISATMPVWQDGNLHAAIPEDTALALHDISQDELAIAINWWPTESGNQISRADLDIWGIRLGQIHPWDALYFSNPHTSFGRLMRDITTSGTAESEVDWNSWEVAYLRADQLPNLELFINAFVVGGPLHVRMISRLGDGPLFEQILEFNCPAGLGISSFPNRSASPYWLAIVPQAISGLANL